MNATRTATMASSKELLRSGGLGSALLATEGGAAEPAGTGSPDPTFLAKKKLAASTVNSRV